MHVPFRIEQKTNSKYAYALGKHDAKLVKSIGVFGILSSVSLAIGFISFLKLSTLVAALMCPVLIIILIYNFLQYGLMALYPGFDVDLHRRKVQHFKMSKVKKPTVAVLIAAAGEDPSVVEATAKAASNIDYPDYEVFILDDTRLRLYEKISEKYNTGYANRPNTGEKKKAGNLNFALQHLDDFDEVLVLDADFIVRPEILNELVPYAARNVGIVQSPQHFNVDKATYKRSKIEYGAAYIQQDFYRITQVARDRFGAAICVGTNALYNRRALKAVGGYEGVGRATWGHSEDVNTGLKIINSRNRFGERYKIKYVPIQLAVGTCPDTQHAFYKQQNRWCTGSVQLTFSKKTFFSKYLTLPQKLCYVSNSLYYFSTIALLISPLYLLLITLTGNGNFSWHYTIMFIPTILLNYLINPYVLRKKLHSLAISLVVLSNAYTYAQALILLAIRKPLGWDPTGVKSSKSGSKHFTQFKILSSITFIVLYIFTLFTIIVDKRIGLNPSIIITALFISSLTVHLYFLQYLLLHDISKRRLYLERKVYAMALIASLVIMTPFLALHARNTYSLAIDKDYAFRIHRTSSTVLSDLTK